MNNQRGPRPAKMARALQLVLCSFVYSIALLSFAQAAGESGFRLRGPNMGGWLVTEGWIRPSLFDGIVNIDFTDGAALQFKSVRYGKYLSASNGGSSSLVANVATAGAYETFKVWRVNETFFQLRVNNKKFVGQEVGGVNVIAVATSPSILETFELVRKPGDETHIKIKASNGFYLQVKSEDSVTSDYNGEVWSENDSSVFVYTVLSTIQGEYQITNGYGPEKASKVMNDHWNTFITEEDFKFIAKNGFNGLRIPVGWWTAFDPHPPAPFVAGSLKVLDNAYAWAMKYKLKIVLSLHAAPVSQNGYQQSGTRDGSIEWGKLADTVTETLEVIDFFVARYSMNPSFLAVDLLNEPLSPWVPLETVVSYYAAGYDVVRRHSQTAYVVMSSRVDDPYLTKYSEPTELIPLARSLRDSVLDVHFYNLNYAYFTNMTAEDNINFIITNRTAELASLNASNGIPLIYVGEWSCDWDVSFASEKQIRTFAATQIEVYDTADFGWTYWTLKHVQNIWSMEWLIKNGYFNTTMKRPFSYAKQASQK